MTYQLHHGNMLDILPMMERESIDAIVTDPPYGLGFMGKDWDHGVPGEHFWREAYRVSKPGAHLLAFGGTRTFHRLACAIEDAGWEIRDTVMWVYGQGFPKSHDVSKAIDREAGAEREIGKLKFKGGTQLGVINDDSWVAKDVYETQPATPAAAEWDGWGTALKPAWEPIIVARKPLQGTVAENVQQYGTGAMNVDACRIETSQDDYGRSAARADGIVNKGTFFSGLGSNSAASDYASPQGRWPANLIHDGSAEVLAGFPVTQSHGGGVASYGGTFGNGASVTDGTAMQRFAGDTGSAARFFYCAKASKQDRDEGLEGFELRGGTFGQKRCAKCGHQAVNVSGTCQCDEPEWIEGDEITKVRNHHPTVKPTSLMRYLCRLVTPPAGVILDPFMGSGSTGKAAILEGFNFVGVDNNIEYVEIAARRIEHACGKVGIVVDQPMMFDSKREMVDRPKQLILL